MALAAVLATVAAGCGEQSRVAPEATVTVRGTVAGADGTPLAGRPVRLGAGITEGEAAFAVLTVGLSCTSGECRGEVRDTTTDDAGNYSFAVPGHETQSSFGEAVSILVSATGATPEAHVSGPLVSARFRVQTEVVQLPAMALVDPGLVLDGATDVATRWSTPRPGPYELTFETADATPIWKVTTNEATAVVDGRILEDSAGRAVVSGSSTEAIEGSDVALQWRSPGRGYAGGFGPPPSRGRACRYVDAGGRGVTERTCELTDGDFTGFAASPQVCDQAPDGATSNCAPPVAVDVDLGTAVPAELVVVRGCEEEGCAVDVSGDGVNYRPVGAPSTDFGTVALDGQPVSFVRVGLGSASDLREISVWGPRPERPALRPLGDDRRRGLGERFGFGDDGAGGIPLALVIAAVAATVAVLLALGYTLGRRRS